MNNTLWDSRFSGYDVRLSSWDVAYELAMDALAESGGPSVDVGEYRPPTAKDICTQTLTDETWDLLSDILRDYDDMCTDDGYPIVDTPYKNPGDERPLAWYRLRAAINHILDDHLDLSEAAWQFTGRVRRVSHDGTSYFWEEISGVNNE